MHMVLRIWLLNTLIPSDVYMHFQPVGNLLTTCWSTGWKWLEGRHQQVDFFGQPVVNRLTTGWTKNSNLLKELLNRLTIIVENRIPTASNRLKFFPTCCQQVDNRLIFFFNWLELLGQPVEEHLSTCCQPVANLLTMINRLKAGSKSVKMDMKQVFRIFPISPDCFPLMGFFRGIIDR